MKKILKRKLTCIFGILAVFFSVNLSSNAAYCNSPCPNPCAPSRTICKGTNCTTYCNTTHVYDASWNYTPEVTFSYSTPNVSFSISNEYVGLNVVKFNGRPIYHYRPAVHHTSRPVIGHPPVKPPVAHKPAPNKPITHKPPQRPIYDKPVVKPKTTVKSVSKPAKRV